MTQFAPVITRWIAERAAIRATRTKLGLVGYLHLSAMLKAEPMTAAKLARAAGLGHIAAHRFIGGMHRLGRVHIARFDIRPKAPVLPMFAWGAGVDAEPPTHRPSGRKIEGFGAKLPEPLCPHVGAYSSFLRSIEQIGSRVEVIERTGLDKETCKAALECAVSLGLAHIPLWLWREHGGAPLPQYQLGEGHNAQRPSAKLERKAAALKRAENGRKFSAGAQLHRYWQPVECNATSRAGAFSEVA